LTNNVQAKTWRELIQKLMIFLESNHLRYQKSLYASSTEDYGSIVVWPTIMTWKGEKYSAIKLMHARVPPELRRRGEYKRLLSLLERCGLYGLRIVETVQDENLVRYHQSEGDQTGPNSVTESPTFLKIVGAPLPKK
jgi:hypothetical protein